MTGLVFDIQRCSLHDGPGIRTTVFLKGCPLACLWCHNPESISPAPELSFLEDRCTRCGACVQICPRRAHQVADGRHLIARACCAACGTCVAACPNQALRIVGEEMEADDVLGVAARDRAYYDRSGGGLTLSGGEPMLQFDFTLALLRGARARGLHTCLDTCGLASQEQFAQVLPFVDLFLFDYKATDPEQHRALTGATNEQLLEALAFLDARGAAVVLRCPLIPGVNDSAEHLAGIAALAARFPRVVGVEVMPFHTLGREKARTVGREVNLRDVPTADDATVARWLSALHELGCAARRG